MMYDNLVKKLRYCGNAVSCIHCPYWEGCGGTKDDLAQAADAIEELQKIANKLLAKYQEEATSVIWEYSGHIDESLDYLYEEVRTLQAQINGKTEPPKEES